MVPPASHRISRVSWYSGSQPTGHACPLRDSHPLWSRFPTRSSTARLLVLLVLQPQSRCPKDDWFGLFPVRSPLLRESRLISFPRGTEMFQFPTCPPSPPMYSAGGLQTSLWRGCPIRNLGFIACMQLPPNVSPVSASFFGLERQGIHLVLCVACSLLLGSCFLCEQELADDLRECDPLFHSYFGDCHERQWRFSKIEGLYLQLFNVRLPESDPCGIPPTTKEWKPVSTVSWISTVSTVPVRPGNGACSPERLRCSLERR